MPSTNDRARLQTFKALWTPEPLAVWQLAGAADRAPFFYRAPFRIDQDAGPDSNDPDADPITGLSIAPTALHDRTRKESDRGRYIDTNDLPFLTLSVARIFRRARPNLGDYATVINPRNRRSCHAIIGDTHPEATGVGSIYLAQALGLRSEPSPGRSPDGGVLIVVYPGSGAGQGTIPTIEQLRRRGGALFRRAAPPARPGIGWGEILADAFAETLPDPYLIDCTLSVPEPRRLFAPL